MQQAPDFEFRLQAGQKRLVFFWFAQVSDYSGAGIETLLRRQPVYVLQADSPCNLVIDSSRGIVKTGVCGIYGDAAAKGLGYAALLISSSADLLQRMEKQRVVRYDEVAAAGSGLVDDSFGHVKADKHPCDLRVHETDLQPRVVIVVLEIRRGILLQTLDNLAESHYLLRSCFTRVEIVLPSASPASCFVATPITLPMSEGWVAPVWEMISLIFASISSAESCFGRYSSSTLVSASSLSASSWRLAATNCSAASLRCFTSFWINLMMSESSSEGLAPSAVLAMIISDFIERTALVLTWSWAFMAVMMSCWIFCSNAIIYNVLR